MSTEKSIRVLLVDDEPAIRRSLRLPLQELGFQVVEASRGEESLHLARVDSFDVVLLDINMPGIGGMKTLERLRAMAPRLPILMLTVRDDEKDKVEALEMGADDYITKPFSFRECLARIRSAVRRAQTPERPEDLPITIGEIEVQPARRTVKKSGQPIRLTPKEYDILYYLMAHAGRAVTHGKLLTSVWGAQYRQEVDYLRTFVRQLRKKIEDDPSNPRYLLTDTCVGYRFAEEVTVAGSGESTGGDAYYPML
ncbi:MAG TPA: response regulator transcription factor [Terracidiphilus sp.]|nr:response regulator transcription factor [Terracidiphilus sp.]